MANLPGVITSIGNVRAHTAEVAEEITARWRLTFVWGIGATGEHAQGRALDFMGYDGGTVAKPGPMRPQVCAEIAAYLWANRSRLGVWYVIWNRRIISTTYPTAGWKTYTGSNPHTDHVHVSFRDSPPAYRPPAGNAPTPPEDLDMTPAELRKIIGEEIDKRVGPAVWSHRLVPGPAGTRIGAYDPKTRYSAGGFQVGPDAYARELRRVYVPAILDALADVAKLAGAPMPETERDALAAAIAERTDGLRVQLDHVPADEPAE